MSRKKRKNYIPIQTLIAYNNTDAALKLLEKNGYQAKDLNDLQIKLTELYKNSPDKMEIEKEFVEIHPHKNLFLKHLTPKDEPKEDKTVVEVGKSTEKAVNDQIRNTVVHDGYSNCEGNPNCNCNKNYSNACGCSSGFDGTGKQANQQYTKNDNFNSIVVLGIVAIFGMLIFKNKI
jgi:hypothetical protein